MEPTDEKGEQLTREEAVRAAAHEPKKGKLAEEKAEEEDEEPAPGEEPLHLDDEHDQEDHTDVAEVVGTDDLPCGIGETDAPCGTVDDDPDEDSSGTASDVPQGL